MTKSEYDKMPIGQHAWAMRGSKLLIVMKDEDSEGFEVCGPWECGTGFKDVQIIELINRPAGHEQTKLHYCDIVK